MPSENENYGKSWRLQNPINFSISSWVLGGGGRGGREGGGGGGEKDFVFSFPFGNGLKKQSSISKKVDPTPNQRWNLSLILCKSYKKHFSSLSGTIYLIIFTVLVISPEVPILEATAQQNHEVS